MRGRWLVAAAAAAATGGAAPAAHAGGFEYPDNGSLAMGRGGAFVARASDPTALMHNVAGIAGLQGFQLTVSSNFALLGHCFSREGSYQGLNENVSIETSGTVFEGSTYADTGTPYPRVCNAPGVFPAPQLLATYRVNQQFAIGVGVYGPNAVGKQNFPDRVTADGQPAPSPIRHMLLRENLLILHPTVAAAWTPAPWLRVGVAVQPSFGHFQFFNLSNAVTTSAQSPHTDIGVDIDATAFFMAGNLGVQVLPSRYLSFGAHVHVNQSPTATGRARATTNYYAADMGAQRQSEFPVTRMEVPLPPVQARLGARFALPRPGVVTQNESVPGAPPYDPMRDEVFDVELDLTYEAASAFQAVRVETDGEIDLGTQRVRAPSPLEIPHRWRDVYGARLGGDFNAVPGVLALRGGVSFETGAQSTTGAHIDIPAYDSLGLHLGVSVRTGWLTASVAYGHFFMSGLDARDGNLTTISTMGALTENQCTMAGGAGEHACQINRGRYEASLDVFNVGLTARW